MRSWLVLLAFAGGCLGDGSIGDMPGDVGADPAEIAAGAALPDVRCEGAPQPGPAGSWRHWTSYINSNLGGSRHRGIDLVTDSTQGSQTLRGEIKYGLTDKSLEDEWVQLYACRAGGWTYLGPVLTDGEGNFSLALTGAARLPTGLRDMFVSVYGDRSSARFLALVAPAGTPVAISDVDGTLTSSENAFVDSRVTGATVAAQPGASSALAALHGRGFPIVYVTARGRYFTGDTMAWLAANGMPRGPTRLAPSLVTLPGDATISYKVGAIQGLGLPASVGIGNRGTDAEAYLRVGIAGNRSFMLLPEFESEVDPYVSAGHAVGFTSYAQIATVFAGL
jgi:hypothetical protein